MKQVTAHRAASHTSSEISYNHQNNYDEENQAKRAARVIPPAAAIWPNREYSQEYQDQDNKNKPYVAVIGDKLRCVVIRPEYGLQLIY